MAKVENRLCGMIGLSKAGSPDVCLKDVAPPSLTALSAGGPWPASGDSRSSWKGRGDGGQTGNPNKTTGQLLEIQDMRIEFQHLADFFYIVLYQTFMVGALQKITAGLQKKNWGWGGGTKHKDKELCFTWLYLYSSLELLARTAGTLWSVVHDERRGREVDPRPENTQGRKGRCREQEDRLGFNLIQEVDVAGKAGPWWHQQHNKTLCADEKHTWQLLQRHLRFSGASRWRNLSVLAYATDKAPVVLTWHRSSGLLSDTTCSTTDVLLFMNVKEILRFSVEQGHFLPLINNQMIFLRSHPKKQG